MFIRPLPAVMCAGGSVSISFTYCLCNVCLNAADIQHNFDAFRAGPAACRRGACLLGEGPQELQVVGLEAALGRQDLEYALHLVHVLALVQVRPQQRPHDVRLHQPFHQLLRQM